MRLRRVGATRNRLAVLEGRAQRQHERIADLERELMRLSPQVAALEARCEDLRQQLDSGPTDVKGPGRHEVRTLLDDVRREHARIRARITAATVFEERLRQVEERLDSSERGPD